ncbi:UDP-N-acetylglucosamine diphosphorylase/glucosamine-1-phosphate N-acetyltransferase [Psittacicella melopsittaci]|uniref:Bifunctional protein GlmU n=1 Tax=Psittacicella melopsittaci TaxID=2028576 RepID=A0A3A1Y5H0_9GAMM|nr:bifunctional UDP-N-acetylglucosamine diphosphorylase/glucosamine-1-phosphate N-acetyltransferase GlmU [Psittacicella melopsittaci]RIY32519.1 UDP-N-acetylglucosamine diphosphorylase/glucosamine-1-phosphate N-acetyltransferase [Psittacicella melopsittaci]
MSMFKFCSIVLAAGAGTRMKSDTPKIMHKVAGKSMIKRVLEQIDILKPERNYLVYGFKGELLQEHLKDHTNIIWAYQQEQLGTAHAAKVAADLISDNLPTLLMFSDNPLIQASTIEKLFVQFEQGSDIVLMTTVLDNPFGYGRVVRDQSGNIKAIVEEKDASDVERQVKEVFPGIIFLNSQNLQNLLAQVDNKNAQNEYYLTDIIKLAYAQGQKITSVTTDFKEVSSANTKYQLAQLEDYYHQMQIKKLSEQGLILHSIQPNSITLTGELEFGQDCDVDVNCQFHGKVKLGNNVKIGQGCIISNCQIGDNTVIEPYTIMQDSVVGAKCAIGPFARLRPNSLISDKAKVGNFVETKNTKLGYASKASHLTYLGDSEVGADVNIGAGVITCNYDGANKFKTIIGDNVFVGSDCQLVAPVTIANGATIAAGTTVLKDVTSPALVLNKKETLVKEDWQRPEKIKK